MSLPFLAVRNEFLILNGKYDDFHSMWYFNIGTQIMLTMLIGPIIQQFGMLKALIFKNVRRWFDRDFRFSLNSFDKKIEKDRENITKTDSQEVWEKLYTGNEFKLPNRIS